MPTPLQVINPATEAVIAELDRDTRESIFLKYTTARKAARDWACRPLEDRLSCIARFADLVKASAPELTKTLTLEVGKPIQESRNEIAGALTRIQFFLENSRQWLMPKDVNEVSGTREVLEFEPLGVIANISAWNYPYLVGVNVFIPALIAGNAVLYKPSEFSSLTGLHIARLLGEAGVPQEVFQPILGEGDVGKALLDLPLDGYFFTGSYRTGQSIAKALAGRLVPIGLELGGKDPLYVADDVEDIAKVAASAVEGSFYNTGQSCCAVERIYVHEKVYEAFVKVFIEETKKLVMGDPLNETTTVGAITRPVHLEYLTAQVKDAVDRGATLLYGGKRAMRKGSFFEPTVFTDVDHTMSLMKDETFGPVIGIQKVSGDEEALTFMNDTEYGLTASVYSKDEARAKRILRQLDVGTGYWNCCDRVSPWLPWSGRRHSGFGSTLSYLGIQAFAKPKGYHLR